MKKKILFIHHCPVIGGAGISAINALNSIDKDLYDIVVYCNSTSNGMIKLFKENGYDVITGGNSPVIFSHCVGGEKFILSPKSLINYIKIVKDYPRIDNLIRNIDPDIVMLNSMTLFWIGKIAKKYNKETICFFRETYVKGLLGLRTAFIKRQLSKYMDKIAFISNYDLLRSASVNSNKVTIYDNVDDESYNKYNKLQSMKELRLPTNTFKLLYVGGMSALKGALIIIKAMSFLKRNDIKLIFVGYEWNGERKKLPDCNNIKRKIKYLLNIDYEKKCIDYLVKNSLQNKIIFYDHQPNIAPFFVACDALVFPMTKPHQARPLFEAGYAKIPVVITDFPNIKEFADENSCYLFKNKDSIGLSKAILKVIGRPGLAMKKVNLNYINAINKHNKANYEKEINKLLIEK